MAATARLQRAYGDGDIDACAHYLSDVVNILEKLSVGAVTRLS